VKTTWACARGILLAAGLVLVASSAAAAQDVIAAGWWDVGLGVGYSGSHKTHEAAETVTGVHALGHAGYVVSEARGPGRLRGNLELLLEPTLVHLSGDDDAATVAGAVGLVRWIFVGTGPLRPFLEAGVGVLGGRTDFPQTSCDRNYVIEGGPGVLLFVSPRLALTAGYRFQHLSNGGACSRNLGLNSSVVHLGVSYFFAR